MAKVVTIRLSEEEYKMIAAAAKIERRPISNFITAKVMEEIEESYYVDSIEMDQIKSDKKLIEKMKSGHRNALDKKGRPETWRYRIGIHRFFYEIDDINKDYLYDYSRQ
jgi:mRNA-degrading endonuclease RelE of RelBE toxin-antitoxin system